MGDIRTLPRAAAPAPDGALVPLERSVGYHVRQLAETWQDTMDRCASAHGVTISQWRYLRELWEEDGLTTGELTRRVGRQGPTTVVAVQFLEKAGLVTVARSAEDRRKSSHPSDPARTKAGGSMSPLIADINDQAMAALTENEILTFKRLIVRIQRTLDAQSANRNDGPSGARSGWPRRSDL